MRVELKHERARKRHWRVRKKVSGTPERPRMSVCFTNKHIYVQFIDDTKGVTLAAVSTLSRSLPEQEKLGANVRSARIIGRLAAEAALARGIRKVVFDRGSARYHWSMGKDGQPVYGKVAALAMAAREAGLEF
ncbi:50S ribosomal protein L18 [Limisphaera ngatamarikiensis]|jgi:large subunit ribosomal protein L18|uniref:Large ribosomal subunit protein uL18 n=1 Tax=Limisphaera ngatamarikiensis TaxID=1324935 RepID=A0A6M1S446_9BACT|nr:50S ribosomal protein L18 [Limisphaera ngatamarikiensis]NGO40070.1 50S ribosomal protein L18 [Limisphaera ngatamarikiensis]